MPTGIYHLTKTLIDFFKENQNQNLKHNKDLQSLLVEKGIFETLVEILKFQSQKLILGENFQPFYEVNLHIK